MKRCASKSVGSIRAGGVLVPLDSPNGEAIIKDSVRFTEGTITEDEFRGRWELDDAEWAAIGDNKELLSCVRDELRQRIESGDAARDTARFAYPAIVKGLVDLAQDAMVSPRHRIEA